MITYTILNSENIVIDSYVFANEPEDLIPFIHAAKITTNDSNVSFVKVEPHHTYHNIGFHYDGERFKPKQPFPSWKWDEELYNWRSPVLHPHYWSLPVGATQHDGYKWDEDTGQWITI